MIALLLAVKLVLLAFDAEVRLFFGDSASYLHSALTGWIPPDRSFLYGFMIRGTALAAHSMLALAVAQSVLGAVTAALLFRIARDDFALPAAVAAVLALALAIEPAQLFYERMVMAESAGTTALAAMICAGLAYVRRPHWLWPPLWAAFGIVAVALRVSALPLVIGFALLPVLVRAVASMPRMPPSRFALHLLIAIVSTASLHQAYTHWYGRLARTRPDYIEDSGYFRLGLVAPLVTREEVERVGLPSDLLERVGPRLDDPRAREAQIWQPDGLIARVREASADPHGRTARKLAAYAVRGDPVGLLRLAWSTSRDYFDPEVVSARIADDVGNRPADDDLVQRLRECCDYDVRGLESRRGRVARYFVASTPWLTACYFGLVPLAVLMLIANWRRARGAALLLALTAVGAAASQALFSHIVSFRYLHPLPFLLLLCIGATAGAILENRRSGRVQSGSAAPLPTRTTG